MIYFLDTNICIYALKGKYPAIADHILRRAAEDIRIPSMVHAELHLGAIKSRHPQKTLDVVRRFLSPFDTVAFCREAAEIYAEIRHKLEDQGRIIGPNDLVIAATVLKQHGILVTHNTREFSRVPGLKLVDWTE